MGVKEQVESPSSPTEPPVHEAPMHPLKKRRFAYEEEVDGGMSPPLSAGEESTPEQVKKEDKKPEKDLPTENIKKEVESLEETEHVTVKHREVKSVAFKEESEEVKKKCEEKKVEVKEEVAEKKGKKAETKISEQTKKTTDSAKIPEK